jgi:hypothetical protein
MLRTTAAFVDAVSDFLVRKRLESLPLGDLFPRCPEILNGRAYGIQRLASLGDNASYGLVVPGDHDLLAPRDAVQQFPETGSCF